MARASTGRRRGVGSRLGWPLKILVGGLLALLVLIVLNAFALNNETESAELTVPDAELVQTTSGALQVLDTGSPVRNGVVNGPAFTKKGIGPDQPGSRSAMMRLGIFSETPIVLVHGSAGAINWWDELIPLLRPYHRVIAVDMLGYGGSDKPDSDYSIETQAKLVAEVLARLDVVGAVAVGHSLGGKVVTSLAEQAPDLVAGTVLIDTAPDNSFGGLSGGARATRTPLLGQALWRIAPDSMIRQNVSQGFAPGYDVPDEYVEDVRAMTYPAYRKSAEQGEDYTEQASLPDRLTATGTPLLVIFGEEDQIYDAREALSAYAAIPGAETLLVPESGHSPQVEAPAQTATAIERFIWGLAGERAADRAADTPRAARKARQREQGTSPSGNRRQSRNRSAGNRADQGTGPESPGTGQGGNPSGQGSGASPTPSGGDRSTDSRTEPRQDWKPTRPNQGD